jgi:hypothetical protein
LAQEPDGVVKAVQLKEFIITAEEGMDAQGFMDAVMIDSSFYQAFLNLKYFPHRMESFLEVRNKGEKEKANLRRRANQSLVSGKRTIEITSEIVSGKLYNRKGEHRYLTAQMYDEVFFPKEPESVSRNISKLEQEEVKGSKLEEYKSQLKKMMFNPGQEIVSVPFIGDKMDIFSPDMTEYYDYSVFSAYNPDSVWCYVFLVEAKPEFSKNKTVIKRMTSYFDKATMEVMNREYSLSNNTLFFEFDIWMKVDNKRIGKEVVPTRIQYDGEWDIPFKSVENITFDIRCSNYKLNP